MRHSYFCILFNAILDHKMGSHGCIRLHPVNQGLVQKYTLKNTWVTVQK